MNRLPLIRRNLDAAAAQLPCQCKEGIALTAQCHPGAPVLVFYIDGVLTLRCASCHDVIAQIAVASVLVAATTVN